MRTSPHTVHPALLFALTLAGLSGLACAESTKGEQAADTRVISLTRLAEGRRDVEVWARSGDDRLALAAAPGEAIEIGDIPSARDCVLHAGLAADDPRLAEAKVRVTLGGETDDTVVATRSVALVPAGWAEFRVALPSPLPEASALLLEIDSGSATDRRVAWGTPHLVCEDEGKPPAPARPHVILISIDTLRADHLGIYGYTRPTSPRIDALARESLVFDAAFTTSPWTLPAHASMLTGRYPDEHRAGHATIFDPLADEIPTLAERLAEGGYRTVAHVGGGYVGRAYGLDRGFDEWLDRHGASLESVLPETLAALSETDAQPVFLFLHSYGVHAPYTRPARYPSFRESPTGPRTEPASAEWQSLGQLKLHHHLELDRFHDLADLVAAYDSSIRFVDAQIGKLLDFLEARGLLEHSLVIFTSDHGESFQERGRYISHGYTFYDEEVRIPLLVRTPDAARTGRTDLLVDVTDIASLVLEAAGMSADDSLSGASPLARLDGRLPLREQVRGGSAYTGGVYARTGTWKVISPVEFTGSRGMERPGALLPDFDDAERIYEVAADPEEQRDLSQEASKLPAQVWLLRQRLDQQERPGQGDARARFLGHEQRRQLEALGYVDRTAERPTQ